MMIGQERLLKQLTSLIQEDTFPRFIIITGIAGSGKKTLCHELLERWEGMQSYWLPDVKIDTIRDMIAHSYRATQPIMYIIPDADSMSISAKNAILKVTEEAPNKAYFIMTLEDVYNTLETVKSRASVFKMDNYTRNEITRYFERNTTSQGHIDIIAELCDVPGDVDILVASNPFEFYSYVEKVVDNIATVQGANSFKLADKLSIKTDAEGYDLKIFFRAFMSICVHRLQEDPMRYSLGVMTTSKFLSQLRTKGISKQMLIDDWILQIRSCWRKVD